MLLTDIYLILDLSNAQISIKKTNFETCTFMQRDFDSPKFATSNYQPKYFERKSINQSMHNDHIQVYRHPEEVNRLYKDYSRSRIELADPCQGRFDPLSLQLPSFRSPDATTKPFTFPSPDATSTQTRHFFEQDHHLNREKGHSLVPTRAASTRNRREVNSPRNSSSNRKGISTWLAEMERQRVELQRIREEEKRRQRLRLTGESDPTALYQNIRCGAESNSFLRDESPNFIKPSFDKSPFTRDIERDTYSNKSEKKERNSFLGQMEINEKTALRIQTEPQRNQIFDSPERDRRSHSKIGDSGAGGPSSPFQIAQSTVLKMKNDLNMATKWTQRLLLEKPAGFEKNSNDRSHFSEHTADGPMAAQQSVTGQKQQFDSPKGYSRDLIYSDNFNGSRATPLRSRDYQSNFPQYENYLTQGTSISVSRLKTTFTPENENKNSPDSRVNISPPALRSKSNARGSTYEQIPEVKENIASSLPRATTEHLSLKHSRYDGFGDYLRTLREPFNSPVADHNLDDQIVQSTPGNPRIRSNEWISSQIKSRISPEKREALGRDIRKDRLCTAPSTRSTYCQNKSMDFTRRTQFSQESTVGGNIRKDWRHNDERQTATGYPFLIHKQYEESFEVFDEPKYSSHENNMIEKITSQRQQRPSENIQRIGELLKHFRA